MSRFSLVSLLSPRRNQCAAGGDLLHTNLHPRRTGRLGPKICVVVSKEGGCGCGCGRGRAERRWWEYGRSGRGLGILRIWQVQVQVIQPRMLGKEAARKPKQKNAYSFAANPCRFPHLTIIGVTEHPNIQGNSVSNLLLCINSPRTGRRLHIHLRGEPAVCVPNRNGAVLAHHQYRYRPGCDEASNEA